MFKCRFEIAMVILSAWGLTQCKPVEETESETSAASETNDIQDKSDNDGDDSTTSGSLELSFDDIAPAHLAVTSVTETVSSSSLSNGQIQIPASLLLNSSDAPPPPDTQSEDYAAKVKKIQKTLAATDIKDCTDAIPQEFSFAQGNLNHAQCFGPTITLTNHPELDSQTAAGGIGAGEAGMFWDYAEPDQTSGEACGARVVTNVMSHVSSYSDAAMGFQTMISCAASVLKSELPEIGTSKDLTDVLAGIDMKSKNFEISSAVVSREQNTAAGDAVFVTTLKGWMKDVARNIQKNFTLEVKQIAQSADGTKYTGVMQYIVEDFENSKDLAISIAYSWASKELRYRYRQAQIMGATSQDFDSKSEIKTSLADGGSKWTEITSNNDIQGLGKVAIAIWNSDVSIFNAETKTNGTGVAFFGHKSSTEADFSATDSLIISGFKCLPINPPPPGKDPFSEKVQRQTFKLNSGGVWTLDESNISYAPITTCNWTASEDPSGSASFVATNDGHTKQLTFPLTANLYDLSSYQNSWTTPALPLGSD